ncbi:MAG TPA: hypothetical protein VFQ45_00315, partial [Longimicrobium sp.]|nr:hypothetical protein [Longimicrobium sp.]
MTGTKHRNQRNEIPWPGPRPFTAREEAKFFGRESEQRHIVQRIDAGRITVISARSGVGKTSVLRAAVIPQLCRRRKPEPPGVRRRELPICVRDWWAGAPKTPEEAFRSAMLAGLQEM